jgi:hypothetical protein
MMLVVEAEVAASRFTFRSIPVLSS